MLAAVRAIDGFDRRRPFRPWLHRIVVNRSLDWVKARQHRPEVSGDLAAGAEAALAIADAHAGLVDEDLRRRVRASHLTTLGRGRVRRRDYAGAREALAQAAELAPPGPRERALAAALNVPGVRAGLGRRSPFGR
jgi:DNA-directed RNA polymerase specialized sigma24 family protein